MVWLTFVDEMEANNVDDVQYEANHDDDGEVDGSHCANHRIHFCDDISLYFFG